MFYGANDLSSTSSTKSERQFDLRGRAELGKRRHERQSRLCWQYQRAGFETDPTRFPTRPGSGRLFRRCNADAKAEAKRVEKARGRLWTEGDRGWV